MPLKALMMPTTVPNSPTKGAVEPMVARPLKPRFISAWTMATERSRPRLAASITLAMWLFLLRSAMEMASSSLPSRSAPATCCTNTRDCLRAALYMSSRSIITPTDHADMMNRITTTVRAGHPMERHMLIMSQPTACPWNSQRLITDKLASIRFAPFRSLAKSQAGQGAGPLLPDHERTRREAAALLSESENHINRGDHLDRLAVQQGRVVAPLAHGLQSRLLQQRMAGEHLQLHDRAVLGDYRLQPHGAGNARLLGQRRIHGLNLVDQLGGLHLAADADALGRFLWRGREVGT